MRQITTLVIEKLLPQKKCLHSSPAQCNVNTNYGLSISVNKQSFLCAQLNATVCSVRFRIKACSRHKLLQFTNNWLILLKDSKNFKFKCMCPEAILI